MERTTSLEQRLVDPSSSSNDTNGGTGGSRYSLLRTTGQANAGLVVIGRVTNDGGVVSGCAGKSTTVTDLLLNIADDGTLGALAYRDDVSDGEGSLLTAVNEGTSVKTLSSDKSLLAELVAVGVTENDTGKGGTAANAVEFNGLVDFTHFVALRTDQGHG